MKFIINPLSSFQYAGFYIQGIKKIDNSKIIYSKKGFPSTESDTKNYLLFFIEKDKKKCKVVIDYHDSFEISPLYLKWCDVYAKVNFNNLKTTEQLHSLFDDSVVSDLIRKILLIGPGFGINPFSKKDILTIPLTILFSSSLIFKEKKKILDSVFRTYFGRKTIDKYKPNSTFHKKYVFHISNIWHDHADGKWVNSIRANFIKQCKNNHDISFEGGLVKVGYEYSSIPYEADVTFNGGRISLDEYLLKTCNSNFVFNCPAIHKCHGWKLGEYLALGKCIISVPIFNDLPQPLIHGENIHFIENTEQAMEEAINYISHNPEYAEYLGKGAYKYWLEVASPDQTIKTILDYIDKNCDV
jgi:glycosyltransferase involved in cell wall biosynthesis